MKKRITVLAMCAMMVLCLLPATAMAASDTWDGTSVDTSWYDSNPTAIDFTITTGAELAGLAKLVDTGDAKTPSGNRFDFSGVKITLAGDIDLNGHQWTPIGYLAGTTCYSFNGVFEGGGHTISGLALGSKGSPDDTLLCFGLFGSVGLMDLNTSVPNSVVNKLNISVTGIYSSKQSFMGGLAAFAGGKITDCSVTGSITSGFGAGLLAAEGIGEFKDCRVSGNVSAPCAGGLVAILYKSTLTGCHADVSVTANYNYAGGFVGFIRDSNVTDCFATGDVTNSSNYYAGGFAGEIENHTQTITGCYATGSVTSAGGSEAGAGGFAGTNQGEITGCYATGNVKSTGAGESALFKAYLGGFIGDNYIGAISRCFATGSVTGEGLSYIGGFAGRNGASIKNCYASGSVTSGTGNTSYVGGLVGECDSTASVTEGYARGIVSGTGTGLNQGAVAGYIASGATCTGCYYDTRAAGTIPGIGFNPDSLVTTGLATDKMTGSAASGNMTGLNFSSDWTTKANDSKWYYPQLTVFAGSSDDKIKAASLKSVTFTPFTVTFDSGSGSAVASEYGYYSAVGKPADPTRSGSVFGGWYTDSGLNTAYDFSAAVTADITLYAKWTPQYTVTFDVNNGSAVPSQTVLPGGKITKPADPTRDGYFFDGWYTDSGLSTAYDFSAAVSANITLHAKWTAQPQLSSSISDGKIYTGGRIILTANIGGGAWDWDKSYLSGDFGSSASRKGASGTGLTATFTGLKVGTTRVTYTVKGHSAYYDVTIQQAELPQTGQDFSFIYILAGGAGIAAIGALAAGIIAKKRRRAAFNK